MVVGDTTKSYRELYNMVRQLEKEKKKLVNENKLLRETVNTLTEDIRNTYNDLLSLDVINNVESYIEEI